jgi:hypothetical protein
MPKRGFGERLACLDKVFSASPLPSPLSFNSWLRLFLVLKGNTMEAIRELESIKELAFYLLESLSKQ